MTVAIITVHMRGAMPHSRGLQVGRESEVPSSSLIFYAKSSGVLKSLQQGSN